MLPLAVMITTDDTIQQGLGSYTNDAFFGGGAEQGPGIVMTDDSIAERNAMQTVWPDVPVITMYLSLFAKQVDIVTRWSKLYCNKDC